MGQELRRRPRCVHQLLREGPSPFGRQRRRNHAQRIPRQELHRQQRRMPALEEQQTVVEDEDHILHFANGTFAPRRLRPLLRRQNLFRSRSRSCLLQLEQKKTLFPSPHIQLDTLLPPYCVPSLSSLSPSLPL